MAEGYVNMKEYQRTPELIAAKNGIVFDMCTLQWMSLEEFATINLEARIQGVQADKRLGPEYEWHPMAKDDFINYLLWEATLLRKLVAKCGCFQCNKLSADSINPLIRSGMNLLEIRISRD